MEPMKQAPQQSGEAMTPEQLVDMLHPLWRHNQHGAKLPVGDALGAVGSVKPEVKHQPEGEWQGQVDFNPDQYTDVKITRHHLNNKPVAQGWVERSIAGAVLSGQQQSEDDGRETITKVG